jgi:hypothetical protein
VLGILIQIRAHHDDAKIVFDLFANLIGYVFAIDDVFSFLTGGFGAIGIAGEVEFFVVCGFSGLFQDRKITIEVLVGIAQIICGAYPDGLHIVYAILYILIFVEVVKIRDRKHKNQGNEEDYA